MKNRPIPSVAIAILAIAVAAAFLAPILAPASPTEISLKERLSPPTAEHWMGTDELGRDVFSRMLYGSRSSLTVGFAAGLLSLLIGSLLGGFAGAFGGWIDWSISRLIEVVLAFPFLILLLVIIALIGPSLWSIIGALALTGWVAEARFVRGEVMKLKESEFAQAARASGAGPLRTLFRHLLPGSLPPAIVSATFGAASAILVESALSFLGFGIQLPQTSWGTVLASGRATIGSAWWLVLFPGLAIFFTVASIHRIAQWIEDRLATPR
ncbi:MAG: ABC transporter permease [Thermoanaerobaculia bacterium]|nr:ABC transporter permease [Thermoanaerobaculia bacterium]